MLISRPRSRRRGSEHRTDVALTKRTRFPHGGGQVRAVCRLLATDGSESRLRFAVRRGDPGASSAGIANTRNSSVLLAGDLPSRRLRNRSATPCATGSATGIPASADCDHAPFGSVAESLSQQFGVSMGKSWAFDRASAGCITTQLDFSLSTGCWEITSSFGAAGLRKRSDIRSFTGRSLGVSAGATILMKLSTTARDAALAASIFMLRRGGQSTERINPRPAFQSCPRRSAFALSSNVSRRAQRGSAAFSTGRSVRDWNDMKFGMNVPGNEPSVRTECPPLEIRLSMNRRTFTIGQRAFGGVSGQATHPPRLKASRRGPEHVRVNCQRADRSSLVRAAVLFVSDVQGALRFYVDKLGFKKKWHAADGRGQSAKSTVEDAKSSCVKIRCARTKAVCS